MIISTKKQLAIGNIVSAILALGIGALLHFIYEWCPNDFVAVFGAVNESVWEHLKLLFWSMLLLLVPEYFFYGRKTIGFIAVRALSIPLGLLTTLTLFYTYTGIIGGNMLWADILTFVAGISTSYIFSWRKLTLPAKHLKGTVAHIAGVALLATIATLFTVFTFIPPHIGLFFDTAHKAYGIVLTF